MKKEIKRIIAIATLTMMTVSYGFITSPHAEEKDGKTIEETYRLELLKEKSKIKANMIENNSKEMVRFILEVKNNKDINKVKKAVSNIVGVEIKNDYKSTINGFSISAKRGQLVDISKVDGVASVKEAMVFYPAVTSAAEMSKAFSVWKDFGYKGEGMVVAIIDSGVDVSHKDMKLTDVSKAKIKDIKKSEETKFTSKVPYGRNFADNNDIVIENSGVTGNHGMHVSGIVAANGEGEDGVKGIAPEAQILAMKVFADSTGSCFEDDLVAAIEDSVEHGADIINMSLGFPDGTTHYGSALQKAIDKAKEKGVLVVIAAGNESAFATDNYMKNPIENNLDVYDNQMLRYPGNVQSALTVASVENSKKIYPVFDVESSSENYKMTYENMDGPFAAGEKLNGKSFKLLELPIEPESVDEKYKDNFILIKYEEGESIEEFTMKFMYMPKVNVAGIIISGNMEEWYRGMFKNPPMETLYVSGTDGDKLLKISKDNGNITFSKETIVKDNPQKDKMSSFTSFGPTADLDFKPDVSGVGGNVVSTLNNNKYGVMSGTSMATPHVSGAEALILQAMREGDLDLEPSEKIDFAKNTTLNTSQVLEDKENGEGLPYSPRRQGAGFIQIDKAVKNRVILTDAKRGIGNITLGEIGTSKEFEINIKNYGDVKTTFALENSPILSEKNKGDNKQFASYEIAESYLKYDKKDIVLLPGESVTIKATLNLPLALEKHKFIEGYIKLINKDNTNPDLSIPYMGFYGNFDKESIFDKPLWEEGSKLNVTSVVDSNFELLGNEEAGDLSGDISNIKINKENIAISPLESSLRKEAVPTVAVLRNTKDLDVDIVDGNNGKENVIRNLSNKENIFRYQSLYLKYNIMSVIYDGLWDGKVYDARESKFKSVKDGQYYFRVKGRVFTPDAKEEMLYLPIKIDTTAPEVNVINKEIIENDGGKLLKLTWKATDKGEVQSGIDKNSIRVFINGQIAVANDDLTGGTFAQEDGTFETIVNLVDDNLKDVSLALTDGAGNISTASTGVVFEGLTDGAIINTEYLNSNGKVELRGFVTNEIKKITLNGVEAKINSGNFTAELDLAQGENAIETIAYNERNEIKYKESYEVYVDTIAPVIEFAKSKLISEDEKGNKEYRIYGKLQDIEANPSEITIVVNDNICELQSDGTFETNIIVKKDNGEDISSIFGNLVSVVVIDSASNATFEMINLAEIEFTINNVTPVMLGQAMSPQVVENGKAYITGEIGDSIKEATLNGIPVKIEDGKYSIWVPVEEGINNIKLKLKYKDEKEISDTLKLLFINGDPKLNINIEDISYTNKESITVSGDIKGMFGVKLNINGNNLVNNMNQLGIIVSKDDPKFDTQKFSKTISLKEGNNTINVETEDIIGNKKTYKYFVVKKTTAPSLDFTNIKDKGEYNKGIKPIVVSEEFANVTMTLNGIDYKGEEINTVGSYTLIATATDRAGNTNSKTVNFKVKEAATSGEDDGDDTSNNGNNPNPPTENGNTETKPTEGVDKIPNTGAVVGSRLLLTLGLLSTLVGGIFIYKKH